MNILEHEIEDVIWEEIEGENFDGLYKRGLPIFEKFTYTRQLELNGYGRADLIGINVEPSHFVNGKKTRFVNVQIFELKKEEVNLNTFLQAIRYAKGIQHKASFEKIEYSFYFYIYLIGKRIELNSPFVYIPDIFGQVNFYTVSISLEDGIMFNRQKDYTLLQPCFKKGSNDLGQLLRQNVDHQKFKQEEWIYIKAWHEERDRKKELAGPDSDVSADNDF